MDRTTDLLSSYACGLTFEDLGPDVIHQVKRTFDRFFRLRPGRILLRASQNRPRFGIEGQQRHAVSNPGYTRLQRAGHGDIRQRRRVALLGL